MRETQKSKSGSKAGVKEDARSRRSAEATKEEGPKDEEETLKVSA